MNCALQVGAIIFDDSRNKKRYVKGSLFITSIKNSNKSRKIATNRKIFNSPWWDKECDKLINRINK